MPLINRTYVDVDLDFIKHPATNDINRKVGAEAIRSALYNAFGYNKYEKPFNPEYGANVRRFLFEPIDMLTTDTIKDLIRETITAYEPRIQLQSLVVIPDIDANGYRIRVAFFMVNDPKPITINLFLERLR